MTHLITPNQNEITELEWIETIWQRPIQRIFWVYDVPPNTSRGGHHHRSCRMVLQCLKGSVEVYVQTAQEDHHFTLDSRNKYLFLEAQDWRLMHQFSTNALLMVFADKSFETTIYIDQPYRFVNSDLVVTSLLSRKI